MLFTQPERRDGNNGASVLDDLALHHGARAMRGMLSQPVPGRIRSLLLAHPTGLYYCFATELWERFSYYGMRALLIFYLTRHFQFSDKESYAIYGSYTALAWGLPVIGGVLADRSLGQRRAVTLGAVLLTAGHLLMAVEGPPATAIASDERITMIRDPLYLDLFFLSLALIATGVGFLKPSISTLVGALYARSDPRRDAGFTIFYLGINLGATLAPLLCGWLGQRYGWSYGFGLAGIGMLVGLWTFLRGRKHLPPDVGPQPSSASRATALPVSMPRILLGYLSAPVAIFLAWSLLKHGRVGELLAVFGTGLAAAILYFSFARCSPAERNRMLVVSFLICFAILFWSLYEQIGSSLNLFADRLVRRSFLGAEFEASQLQALPGLAVILLAPLFGILWNALASRDRYPNEGVKFSIGLVAIGGAFAIPALAAIVTPDGEKLAPGWFAAMCLLMVCGELCVAPIAMSMVTRLCPQRVVGMMMGSYFLSLSLGSFIAGRLAALTHIETGVEQRLDESTVLWTFVSAYVQFGAVAVGAGILLYVLTPLLERRIRPTTACGVEVQRNVP